MTKALSSKNHLNERKIPAEMKFLGKKIIRMEKVLNKLDKFALEFTKILNKQEIRHVIVSGYVAILFGRSRATEDIDLIVARMSKSTFLKLFKSLSKKFECLNSSNPGELYDDYLCQGRAIRFSSKNKPIPNIEFKFAKTKLDEEALKQVIIVKLGSASLTISSLELQIAFKEIVLGSDKDLEDAEHLKTVFEERLNTNKLDYYRRLLKNE